MVINAKGSKVQEKKEITSGSDLEIIFRWSIVGSRFWNNQNASVVWVTVLLLQVKPVHGQPDGCIYFEYFSHHATDKLDKMCLVSNVTV